MMFKELEDHNVSAKKRRTLKNAETFWGAASYSRILLFAERS
jgi:hypothetical protein